MPVNTQSKPGSGVLLSKNNLQRSCQSYPAPIHRSSSSRIEIWLSEVYMSCPDASTSETSSPRSSIKEELERVKDEVQVGRIRSFFRKVSRKGSGDADGGIRGGTSKGIEEATKTFMYDGCKEGEKMRDDWESGAGSSMYRGSESHEESLDERLDRAERLLNRGDGKKVQQNMKSLAQG